MACAVKRVLAKCIVGLVFSSSLVYALEPEEILGEYWKDPLFGVASANQRVQVEVLYGMLFPQTINVPANQRVRFVFQNKSEDIHVFLFEQHGDNALSDDAFKAFVADEVHHASMALSSNDGHVHAHNGANADGTKSIVGRLSDRPTMTLQAHDEREMILMFDAPGMVSLRCILEGHEDLGHESVLKVVAKLDNTETILEVMQ